MDARMQQHVDHAAQLAGQINSLATDIKRVRESLANWQNSTASPSLYLGDHIRLLDAQNKPRPQYAALHREIVAVHERRLEALYNQLEGARHKLAQLGRAK